MILAFLVILGATTNTAAQTCPSGWFDVSFAIIVDTTIPANTSFQDPDLHYFKEVLKFSDQEIDEAAEDAIEFFNTRFGLDFSDSIPNDQGQRFFENAMFFPNEFPFDITRTTIDG